MALIITVKILNPEVLVKLKKYSKELPKIMLLAQEDIAKREKKNLKFQLTRQGLRKRNKIYDSIKVKKLNRLTHAVTASKRAIYLDSARPHWVKLKRGRLIHQWAMNYGTPAIKAVARREGSIKVRPHPFIEHAHALTVPKIPGIIERRLKQAAQILK